MEIAHGQGTIRYRFATLDVFTERRFGGNPLAVVLDADGLSGSEMQSIAAEFNLSETAFVLPPDDPSHTAKVRIFHRTAELAFAGHPTVGTGYLLAASRPNLGDMLYFEEKAGLVEVRIERSADGKPAAATITAPQPLALGEEVPAELISECVGLHAADIVTAQHPPIWASMGNPFVIAEVANDALVRAAPRIPAFRRALSERPAFGDRFSLHLYARDRERILRARMFAPLAGTFEDAATGSANAPLGGLLLKLSREKEARYTVIQGVEMGRPSILHVVARRAGRKVTATVGGACVPVMSGELEV
jgi:trans-2,3-dihydro-3-hydroxyanthranilate isomerase